MWDNRLTKRNPKAPDYRCRDRSCDGVVWPQRAEVGGEDVEVRVVNGNESAHGREPV
jgi:hypothetical protein